MINELYKMYLMQNDREGRNRVIKIAEGLGLDLESYIREKEKLEYEEEEQILRRMKREM